MIGLLTTPGVTNIPDIVIDNTIQIKIVKISIKFHE